jgi:hypothetical protein
MSEPPPRTPPACKHCRELGTVSVVTLSFTHEGAEFWKCETCGRVWATRDREEINPDE